MPSILTPGVAVSDDGVHWERIPGPSGRGAVLEAHQDPERFDSTHVGVSCVRRWLMFYEGVRADGHSIGLAVSSDGISWERCPGAETDGSVFAHAPSGSGRWDAFAVGTPCVVPADDGTWRLYYVGCNETARGYRDDLAAIQQIGLAVSDGPDFTRWER
jgi:predicted GH43/DUF377 family glycosyl hydrolase